MAEVADPIQALMDSHTKRMQEIADEGFAKAKEVAGDAVARLKRHAGLREAVISKTLEALGIKEVPQHE